MYKHLIIKGDLIFLSKVEAISTGNNGELYVLLDNGLHYEYKLADRKAALGFIDKLSEDLKVMCEDKE